MRIHSQFRPRHAETSDTQHHSQSSTRKRRKIADLDKPLGKKPNSLFECHPFPDRSAYDEFLIVGDKEMLRGVFGCLDAVDYDRLICDITGGLTS